MSSLGLEHDIVNPEVYRRTVQRFREAGILLPTFGQLAAPDSIPAAIKHSLAAVKADEADPRNLFRVHWYNDAERTGQAAVPAHVVLPGELSGVDARIVVAIGGLFPMIRAHKVLAAYGCLAPRIVTGQFDPTRHRAVWPSTNPVGAAIGNIELYPVPARIKPVRPDAGRNEVGLSERVTVNQVHAVRAHVGDKKGRTVGRDPDVLRHPPLR